jgi:hypothetical protein
VDDAGDGDGVTTLGLFDSTCSGRGAVFGPINEPDQPHRFLLWREFGDRSKRVLWVMLNPSSADAEADDPTIRKVVGFSKRWGFGKAVVVNLWSVRSTEPDYLLGDHYRGDDRENDNYIRAAVHGAQRIVCAWGSHKAVRHDPDHVARVLSLLPSALTVALRISKSGHPYHPLYVSYEVEPVAFGGAHG